MGVEELKQKSPFYFNHLVRRVFFGILLIAVGGGFGYMLTKNKPAVTAYVEPIITRQANPLYPLIKPIIRVDFPPESNFQELDSLKSKVGVFIGQQQAAGKVKRTSFYFRDTNDAHWAGLGQDDQYHPASLFKVPYLLALYKDAEIKPQLLNERVYFSDAAHNGADQIQHLVNGRYYTVDELAQAMIKQSDNDAKDLLLEKMDLQFLVEVLNDNGMSLQDAAANTMSPRIYTTFFRTLYNTSFLSPAMSERALELLSEVDFKDGLAAGTPNTIKIAHKFGQYADLAEDDGSVTALELHDCGLVYYPERPYYLCVMTEGYSREELATVIKGVASIVYGEFSKLHPIKKY